MKNNKSMLEDEPTKPLIWCPQCGFEVKNVRKTTRHIECLVCGYSWERVPRNEGFFDNGETSAA